MSILGVEGLRDHKNVPGAIRGTNLGNDPTARITDKILATVHPRPDFEAHVLPAGSEEEKIGLVRVREGTFPPYEFNQGATIRIPIRVGESNRQATVRDTEALFKKRELLSKPVQNVVTSYLEALPHPAIPVDNAPGEFSGEPNFLKMVIVPRGQVTLVLDSVADKRLESEIWRAFCGDREFLRA